MLRGCPTLKAARYNFKVPNKWMTLGTQAGELDRLVSAGEIFVPQGIELYKNGIIWNRWNRHPRPEQLTRPGPGLLESFLKLSDAPDDAADDAVLKYARRWGPLYLCKDGLPVGHTQPDGGQICALLPPPDRKRSGSIWEPVEAWRHISRQVGACLRVADSLNEGKQPDRRLWLSLVDRWPRKRLPTQDSQWAHLTLRANQWIEWGRVRPELIRPASQRHPLMELGVRGVFGAIALEVGLVLARTDGFAFCSACGDVYKPKRRPVTYERRYCAKCYRLGKPVRDAMADRRARRAKVASEARETEEARSGKAG